MNVCRPIRITPPVSSKRMLAWTIERSPIVSRLPAARLTRLQTSMAPCPTSTTPCRRSLKPSIESIMAIKSLSISQSRHHPFHVQVRPDPSYRFPVPRLGSRQLTDLVAQACFIHQFREDRNALVKQRARPVGERT